MLPLLCHLPDNFFENIYGFDISWSRVKCAQKFMQENKKGNINLFVGDLFNIPLADNSIDLVYTCHAIEPNGGKEKIALQELYRVTKQYLILMEPAYELAGDEAKNRMQMHGYVTELYKNAIELGYSVAEYSLYGMSANPLNPTGFMVIKKGKDNSKDNSQNNFCCPLTKKPLDFINGAYYSNQSLLVYPVLDEIPCLTKDSAIVATKFGIK